MRITKRSVGALITAGVLAATLGACSSPATEDAQETVAQAEDTTEAAETPEESAIDEDAEQTFEEVTFGTYQGEDITWLVLADQDGKKLLITKSVVDAQPYQEAEADAPGWAEGTPRPTTDTPWEASSLRAWLNDEFLNNAFSADEQGAIIETTLTDSKSTGGYRDPADFDSDAYTTAPETQDNVFVLSASEARRYFHNDAARVAFPTDYAKTAGVYTGVTTDDSGAEDATLSGASPWWLRTNGYYAGYQSVVTDDGYIHGDGYRADGETHDGKEDHGTEASALGGNFGVRPAVWVDAAALN